MSHRRRHQRSAYWSKWHRFNTAWARAMQAYKEIIVNDIYRESPIMTMLNKRGLQ